jgi:hypothetical protein
LVARRYNVNNMFFGIGKHGPDARYGALLDVGSGSAAVAIVVSEPNVKYPKIIWSFRERMIVKADSTAEANKKALITCIFNAMLELGNMGVRTLNQYDKGAKISTLNVSFCAPWSYTTTRNINLDSENPFDLTNKIIKELVTKAKTEAKAEIAETYADENLNLLQLNDETIEVTANGYRVHSVEHPDIRKVTLSQLISMVDKDLFENIIKIKQKILPQVTIIANSFMLMYHRTLANMHPDTTEVCLVDITAEATELGIVRDSVLVHTTNTAFGMYTLARKITDVCLIPKEEALGVMKDNATNVKQVLSPAKQEELEAVFKEYETNLADLFRKTGDALSIPKTIFLHTDAETEAFFSERVKNAANLATNSSHATHPITSQFFEKSESGDTAILLSAYVFHKKLHESKYLDV